MGLLGLTVRAIVITLLAALGLAASAVTASAADCTFTFQTDGSYKTVCPGVPVDTPPTTPPAGVPAPSCDLKSEPLATYCSGSMPCYDTTTVAVLLPPTTVPPTPDAKWHTQMCFANSSWTGTALWDAQAASVPSMEVQAIEAIGKIVLPTPTLRFNPTNRTLVNLDTWFWAEDLSAKVLQGSSAFGLIAYATPHGLEVDPGDGSGPFTCTWVTTESDSCAYRYRRSSLGGTALGTNGRPAYPATATATWTLTFENYGNPIPAPAGAPLTLDTKASAAVVVDEVQTIVTSTS